MMLRVRKNRKKTENGRRSGFPEMESSGGRIEILKKSETGMEEGL